MKAVTKALAKKINALATKKGRDEHGLFIVEGAKNAAEIPVGWEVECCVLSESFAKGNEAAGYDARSDVFVAGDDAFARLSDTKTPQGVMALCGIPSRKLCEMDFSECLFVFGERISDPGNAGVLLRTSDAAGASFFALSDGSADVYGPKAVRACAGSIFHLPVLFGVKTEELAKICGEKGVSLYAAAADGERLLYETDFTRPCCIAVGNEAEGLSDFLKGKADCRVRLPMPGGAESLNAGVAGSLLIYEALRQRMVRRP